MDYRHHASQLNGPRPSAMSVNGYSWDANTRTSTNEMATNVTMANSSYFGMEDDLVARESGFINHWNFGNTGDDMIQGITPKVGKSVDPRLLALLEFYRELFIEKQELFEKIFPGIHEEFVDFLNKNGEVPSMVKMDQLKFPTLQRSLSVGSPRTPFKQGEKSPMRLNRFKVRTLNLGGVQQSPTVPISK